MFNTLITKLSFKAIVELIFKAEKSTIYCSLNLHQELAVAFLESSKRGVDVKIIIDPAESNYRNGFGDYISVEILQKAGVNIFEIKGNQVSFLISDDIGYFLFPQSKIFSSDPEGPNAVLMDDITRLKFITNFFPPADESTLAEIAYNLKAALKNTEAYVDNLQRDLPSMEPDSSLEKLDIQKFEKVVENLKNNPPLSPDLKRKMNIYIAKIQFVELKFAGAHLKDTKVTIPSKALPFKNAALQNSLQSKLKLFTNIGNNPDLKRIESIAEEVEALRLRKKKGVSQASSKDVQNSLFAADNYQQNTERKTSSYLIPITCRENKSIIRVSDRKAFEEALGKLYTEISSLKQKVSDAIENDILNAKDSIKKELNDFMIANPPNNFSNYKEEIRIKKIADYVDKIISKINFPDSQILLGKLELRHHYYDLTIEDFRDEELLDEFRMRKILNDEELDEIVEFIKAYQVAK